MNKRQIVRAAVLATASVLPLAPARATTIARLSVAEMTQRATHVLHGVCMQVESAYDAEGRDIFTFVTFRTLDRLKGEAGKSFTFVQLGGRVGERAMHVVGSPRFAPGEEAVVFLVAMTPNRPLDRGVDLWLMGLGQGLWRLDAPLPGAQPTATVALPGVHTVRLRGQTIEPRLPLAELKRRVRAATEKPAGPKAPRGEGGR